MNCAYQEKFIVRKILAAKSVPNFSPSENRLSSSRPPSSVSPSLSLSLSPSHHPFFLNSAQNAIYHTTIMTTVTAKAVLVNATTATTRTTATNITLRMPDMKRKPGQRVLVQGVFHDSLCSPDCDHARFDMSVRSVRPSVGAPKLPRV